MAAVWLPMAPGTAAETSLVMLDGSETSAQAWKAGPKARRPEQMVDGLRFPCPFNAGIDRFYWDAPVPRDLSSVSSFEPGRGTARAAVVSRRWSPIGRNPAESGGIGRITMLWRD